MNTSTKILLEHARREGYAVGAFNVYNLEGVRAVIGAAQAERSPVMLQLHPAALHHGGAPVVALCLAAAEEASVPVGVHLDHGATSEELRSALSAGMKSVMADGSSLPFPENVAFTSKMAEEAHRASAWIEAELGRLSGTEDGITVMERDSKMTDPGQAQEFVSATGVDALAVCIGNVHGPYPKEPSLDFDRLALIRDRVSVPLVLHGASNLPPEMVHVAIELGIAKLNVNTEVRNAYVASLRSALQSSTKPDLLHLMESAVEAMQTVVVEKLRMFGSSGHALPAI